MTLFQLHSNIIQDESVGYGFIYRRHVFIHSLLSCVQASRRLSSVSFVATPVQGVPTWIDT